MNDLLNDGRSSKKPIHSALRSRRWSALLGVSRTHEESGRKGGNTFYIRKENSGTKNGFCQYLGAVTVLQGPITYTGGNTICTTNMTSNSTFSTTTTNTTTNTTTTSTATIVNSNQQYLLFLKAHTFLQ